MLHALLHGFRTLSWLAPFGITAAFLLSACGGGGSGEDPDADPTITTYAPQTLSEVTLRLFDLNGDGPAELLFNQGTRTSNRSETGTFEYTNGIPDDMFADSFMGGTYRYTLISGTTATLTITGGQGEESEEAEYFAGDISNIELFLDFSTNTGSRVSTVEVDFDSPSGTSIGSVLVNGLSLPLNYNGDNLGDPDTFVENEDIPLSLDGQTYVFSNFTTGFFFLFEGERQFEFTATQQSGNVETGTFTETLPAVEEDVNRVPFSGRYIFTPNRLVPQQFADSNNSDLILNGQGTNGFSNNRLSLDYATPQSGNYRGVGSELGTAGSLRGFVVVNDDGGQGNGGNGGGENGGDGGGDDGNGGGAQ